MRPTHVRRLEVLEGRIRERFPEERRGGEVRTRMGEQLSRLAAARRGELDAGEEAEVHTFWGAFRHRAAELRGEGGKL